MAVIVEAFLVMPTGKQITLDLKCCETIRDKKDKIDVKECILPDRQHLLLDGKQLEESHFLSEYNTQNKSIAHLETLTEDAGSKKK